MNNNNNTISVDNNFLGYDHLVFIGIRISPGHADQIIRDLLKVEEVLEIHELHGKFDPLLKIRAKNLNQLRTYPKIILLYITIQQPKYTKSK
jgi:DNA-binding Lrp family transcriptional regulator